MSRSIRKRLACSICGADDAIFTVLRMLLKFGAKAQDSRQGKMDETERAAR